MNPELACLLLWLLPLAYMGYRLLFVKKDYEWRKNMAAREAWKKMMEKP